MFDKAYKRNSMKTYNVLVIREEGLEPMSGVLLSKATEQLQIEAVSTNDAYKQSLTRSTITFRGQTRRTIIDGTEYLLPNR